MRILVVYASKYGSTKGIAERIARRLEELGQQAAAVPVKAAGLLDGYDAYVIGSAAYMFSWLSEATSFVHRNAALLATKPVWLFSSGPLDSQPRESAVPKTIAELTAEIHPRDHHVFYGAFNPEVLSFAHKMIYKMPAGKKIFIDGDFRDWDDVDMWAEAIAAALTPAGVS